MTLISKKVLYTHLLITLDYSADDKYSVQGADQGLLIKSTDPFNIPYNEDFERKREKLVSMPGC